MKAWKGILVGLILAGNSVAQEQLALRLNEQGIVKILQMALKYNTSSSSSRTMVIPKNLYKFTIKKSQLLSNPIVTVVNDISTLNMTQDLDFYVSTSDIQITGSVDIKSITATMSNSTPQGFDVMLSVSLPQISLQTPSLSLCEDKRANKKNCGDGLKATVPNLKIATKGLPVIVKSNLRVQLDNGKAKIKVISVSSNLEDKVAPTLDINFSPLIIPKISIIINGQESELDTSKLQDEILKRKTFLSKKLLSFAAEFMTSDLSEMINVYLSNQQVSTSWDVLNYQRPSIYNSISYDQPYMQVDNTSTYDLNLFPDKKEKVDILKVMMEQIILIVQNAKLSLSIQKATSLNGKSIELDGLMNFILNNQVLRVQNTLGNSGRKMPAFVLNNQNYVDVNLGISEPLINGTLDLINSTGLFQSIFDELTGMKGFAIKNIKLHFTEKKNVVVVANVAINLHELTTKGLVEWLKNRYATYLERNNNNGIIYFPIEIPIKPFLSGDGKELQLMVGSPFTSNARMINTFHYPTNIDATSEVVRESIMDQLLEKLGSLTYKQYNFNIGKFLNQSGVVFQPKNIVVHQSAYLLLGLNIVDIKFDSKNPLKR